MSVLETELESWHRDYLPLGKGVKPVGDGLAYQTLGKSMETVIDIGAGCGETVLFYLLHGAKFVIAIEPDVEAYRLLAKNFRGDHRVMCIHARMDVCKIDVEGAEQGLLFETHGGMEPYLISEPNKATGVKFWGVR